MKCWLIIFKNIRSELRWLIKSCKMRSLNLCWATIKRPSTHWARRMLTRRTFRSVLPRREYTSVWAGLRMPSRRWTSLALEALTQWRTPSQIQSAMSYGSLCKWWPKLSLWITSQKVHKFASMNALRSGLNCKPSSTRRSCQNSSRATRPCKQRLKWRYRRRSLLET